jgi:hypothetical protein
MDVEGIAGIAMPHIMEMFHAARSGQPRKELNTDEINEALSRLPDTPDEELR